MTDLLDELARASFDTRWHDDKLAKRLIFGRPDITFDEVKAGIEDGTIVKHALEHEYRHARAIIAAIEAGGCRVVPVEAETAMKGAAWRAAGDAGKHISAACVDRMWAAMLAAAPKVTP